jgi:hypothetical protein
MKVVFSMERNNLQCSAVPLLPVPNRSPSSDVNTLQVLLIGITIFHGIRGAVSWLIRTALLPMGIWSWGVDLDL